VITRHPLDFKEPLSLEGSIQAVHSTLADKTDPQFSALVNWKNASNTFGVMLQGFSEKRSLRRDGQELLQYSQIVANQPGGNRPPGPGQRVVSAPDRFLAVRTGAHRKGGLVTVQFKPSRDFSAEATYFSSKLKRRTTTATT
jgi:iron complex outermembrane receptor protein